MMAMNGNNHKLSIVLLRLSVITSFALLLISCFVSNKLSDSSNLFDEVGFFSDGNKPNEYQLWNTYFPQSLVTVNDHDDGGSGEKWAELQTELKIREKAVYLGYNGVILGDLTCNTRLQGGNYSPYSITYYTRYYTPIIYDQEKYQAPLTDYQKKQYNNKGKHRKRLKN